MPERFCHLARLLRVPKNKGVLTPKTLRRSREVLCGVTEGLFTVILAAVPLHK